MNALTILLASIAALLMGYLFYSKYLEKAWGVISGNPTPAVEINDGIDYVPAPVPVLMGHHFASIAGAGPINGPIFASLFGWVPVVLWIVFGGIFFGGVHDFGTLYASIRHKGMSLGEVINNTMGELMKRLFLIFIWLTAILVIAAFTSIVADTFKAMNPININDAVRAENPNIDVSNAGNAATAMISMLFIALAVPFGWLLRRKNISVIAVSAVGAVLIALIIAVGLYWHPIYLDKQKWMYVIGVYIAVASVVPVWILLQPRDYLSSFLLYAMMIIGLLGIIVAHPEVKMPEFTGWRHEKLGPLFPILFITIACGAISGFHSLVASGTTAKQLAHERHARPIAYGAMLIECVLAVMSLLAVAYIWDKFTTTKMAPTAVFADGLSGMFAQIPGLQESKDIVYQLLILTVSAFCLTTLDTATRLARYMFQEFWLAEGQSVDQTSGLVRVLSDKYVATVITVALGLFLGLNGYDKIWTLFGAANQLLAAIGLLAVSVWLGKIGRKNFMFHIPMAFMMTATLTALGFIIYDNCLKIGKEGSDGWEIVRASIATLLFVLAIVLLIKGVSVMLRQSKTPRSARARQDDFATS